MFIDDFRDWTGEIKLADGSVIVATGLRGDKLIAGSVEFDRETGSAVTGQQIDPAELYRVLPETYLRRGAGKVAYEAFARTVGVSFPWDDIPVQDRHNWGLAILGVKEFAGRVLYDKFCDLVEGGLNGTPFLCWAALTDTTHLAWGRAAAAGYRALLYPTSTGSPQQGGVIPGGPVLCGSADGPASSHHIQVHINLPPPESMHGFCDQQGGTDDPRPPYEPNPR